MRVERKEDAPEVHTQWVRSKISWQQRLVKTGGRLIRHAGYYWLLLAEGHPSRRLFGGKLRMLEHCRWQTASKTAERAIELS